MTVYRSKHGQNLDTEMTDYTYQYEIWVPQLQTFQTMTQTFHKFIVPEYRWNKLDNYIVGNLPFDPYEEGVRSKRLKFCVLPPESIASDQDVEEYFANIDKLQAFLNGYTLPGEAVAFKKNKQFIDAPLFRPSQFDAGIAVYIPAEPPTASVSLGTGSGAYSIPKPTAVARGASIKAVAAAASATSAAFSAAVSPAVSRSVSTESKDEPPSLGGLMPGASMSSSPSSSSSPVAVAAKESTSEVRNAPGAPVVGIALPAAEAPPLGIDTGPGTKVQQTAFAPGIDPACAHSSSEQTAPATAECANSAQRINTAARVVPGATDKAKDVDSEIPTAATTAATSALLTDGDSAPHLCARLRSPSPTPSAISDASLGELSAAPVAAPASAAVVVSATPADTDPLSASTTDDADVTKTVSTDLLTAGSKASPSSAVAAATTAETEGETEGEGEPIALMVDCVDASAPVSMPGRTLTPPLSQTHTQTQTHHNQPRRERSKSGSGDLPTQQRLTLSASTATLVTAAAPTATILTATLAVANTAMAVSGAATGAAENGAKAGAKSGSGGSARIEGASSHRPQRSPVDAAAASALSQALPSGSNASTKSGTLKGSTAATPLGSSKSATTATVAAASASSKLRTGAIPNMAATTACQRIAANDIMVTKLVTRGPRHENPNWLYLKYDRTAYTYKALHLDFHWVVCDAWLVEDLVTLLFRRCQRWGLRLVSMPEYFASPNLNVHPFRALPHIPVPRLQTQTEIPRQLPTPLRMVERIFFQHGSGWLFDNELRTDWAGQNLPLPSYYDRDRDLLGPSEIASTASATASVSGIAGVAGLNEDGSGPAAAAAKPNAFSSLSKSISRMVGGIGGAGAEAAAAGSVVSANSQSASNLLAGSRKPSSSKRLDRQYVHATGLAVVRLTAQGFLWLNNATERVSDMNSMSVEERKALVAGEMRALEVACESIAVCYDILVDVIVSVPAYSASWEVLNQCADDAVHISELRAASERERLAAERAEKEAREAPVLDALSGAAVEGVMDLVPEQCIIDAIAHVVAPQPEPEPEPPLEDPSTIFPADVDAAADVLPPTRMAEALLEFSNSRDDPDQPAAGKELLVEEGDFHFLGAHSSEVSTASQPHGNDDGSDSVASTSALKVQEEHVNHQQQQQEQQQPSPLQSSPRRRFSSHDDVDGGSTFERHPTAMIKEMGMLRRQQQEQLQLQRQQEHCFEDQGEEQDQQRRRFQVQQEVPGVEPQLSQAGAQAASQTPEQQSQEQPQEQQPVKEVMPPVLLTSASFCPVAEAAEALGGAAAESDVVEGGTRELSLLSPAHSEHNPDLSSSAVPAAAGAETEAGAGAEEGRMFDEATQSQQAAQKSVAAVGAMNATDHSPQEGTS